MARGKSDKEYLRDRDCEIRDIMIFNSEVVIDYFFDNAVGVTSL